MSNKELKELREAIRSVCKPEHSLYIEGENFKCEWKNNGFQWTAPSGSKYALGMSEVLHYINRGEHVKYFSYDFVA